MDRIAALCIVFSTLYPPGCCEQGWDLLWQDELRETDVPIPLVVQGDIPTWLHGSLIRNGPGQLTTEKNNVSFAFDGLAKLFKFTVRQGKMWFQERFLRTAYFNKTREGKKFPKTAMMGPTHPPYGHFDLPTGNDNTNIQTWRLSGDSVAFSTTDSPVITTFDVDSLQTRETITYPAGIGKVLLSASHPHYLPGSSGSLLVNYVVELIGLKDHEITVFKMGKDHKQIPFGKVIVPYVPYIHSFAVTAHHMLLFVYPLSFQEVCVLEFRPLIQCLHWLQQDVSMFAFPFDGSPSSGPIMTVSLPPHFVMHHVNAFEDDQAFWVDTCAFDSSAPFTSKYVHADLDVMRNQTERNQVPTWPTYKSFRIDRSGGVVEAVERHLRDQDGFVYTIDFPFINPKFDSSKHCKVWGISAYAKNSSEYSDWAIVSLNACSNSSVNTQAWYAANQFPSEAIFVPRPGSSAEDDGVLLSLVVDGGNSTSYLLVLEPSSLKEIARAYLPLGHSTPYQQHGRWFDASDTMDLLV